MSLRYTCNGPRSPDNPRVRKPCGQDVTALILRVPQDGKERQVTCPACGTGISVIRTPREP